MNKDWSIQRIADIIIPSGTRDPRKESDEKFNYVDVSSVSNKTFKITETQELLGKKAPSRARRVIKSGDIIFATVRPTLKRIATVPNNLHDQICSTGYFVFRTKDKIHNRFLFYFLQTDVFMDKMEKLQSGASYPAVNDSQIKQQLICYPPINEQKRIVVMLDQAFVDIEKARANAEQNLKNARELFESYLQQVFSQRGDGWFDISLGNMLNIKHGFAFKSEFFVDMSKYVLLTPGNFYEEGGYRDRGEKQKYYKGVIPKDFILAKGDLLVAMTEQAQGLLGSPALISEDNHFLHNQRLGLIQLEEEYKDSVNLEFLFYLFNTKYFRSRVQETASGLKVRHTSPKKLMAITVGLPVDINVQKETASKFDEIRKYSTGLEDIYKQKLVELDELKKSILQKAFTGELTKEKVA